MRQIAAANNRLSPIRARHTIVVQRKYRYSFGRLKMAKRTKRALVVLIWAVVVLLGWTAYVAHEGYFYFPPATPLCDGEIGAIAVAERSIEVFSVGSDSRAFTLWREHVCTLTNTSPGRLVLSLYGQVWCQFDFEVKPLWLLWQKTGTTDERDRGRHFALPCVWPCHYLGLRRSVTDLAQPAIITRARVTELGTYSFGRKAVTDTNGVYREGGWPPVFVQCTTNIYIDEADLFGLRYEIEGRFHGRSVPVVKRWIHPPIQDPRTGEVQTQTDEQVFAGLHQYSFRGLRKDRHPVPGVWTFQLLHNGTTLCQQSFVLAKANTSLAIESSNHEP